MCKSNPNSQIPNPKFGPRRAVTIVEVLFAILVTSVGLLGAIAIFPVASAQAKKARQNDTVAHSGHSAVHMFDSYDMRDPERWYAWRNVATIDQFNAGYTNPIFIGNKSFCIDTRLVVRNATGNASNPPWTRAQSFPYTPATSNFLTATARMDRVAFFPGKLVGSSANAQDQFDRLNSTTTRRNEFLADLMFMLEDDLLSLRPGFDDVSKLGFANDRSIPAIQQFDGGFSSPQKRQSDGRLSWMATIVPRVDLNTSLASDRYNLSIVVFNDRPDLDIVSNENVLERTVAIDTATNPPSGEGGGEVELVWLPGGTYDSANDIIANERLKVGTNDWMLLSSVQSGINCFHWYRVAQRDSELTINTTTNRYSRFVSLIGPDFDPTVVWQATLIDGVVAVYEKTIRMNIH